MGAPEPTDALVQLERAQHLHRPPSFAATRESACATLATSLLRALKGRTNLMGVPLISVNCPLQAS